MPPIKRHRPRRLTAGIELQDVSFSYPGTDHEVLSGVSLHLPAAGTVAIVGENGAGKTTLVKLLCRFLRSLRGVAFSWMVRKLSQHAVERLAGRYNGCLSGLRSL